MFTDGGLCSDSRSVFASRLAGRLPLISRRVCRFLAADASQGRCQSTHTLTRRAFDHNREGGGWVWSVRRRGVCTWAFALPPASGTWFCSRKRRNEISWICAQFTSVSAGTAATQGCHGPMRHRHQHPSFSNVCVMSNKLTLVSQLYVYTVGKIPAHLAGTLRITTKVLNAAQPVRKLAFSLSSVKIVPLWIPSPPVVYSNYPEGCDTNTT